MAKRVNVVKDFNKILQLVPEDRKPIAESLAKELSFMARTLDVLRDDVDRNGVTAETATGTQKESPALKSYNTTIQRYSLLYKQLSDLIPKQDAANGELLDFIKRG